MASNITFSSLTKTRKVLDEKLDFLSSVIKTPEKDSKENAKPRALLFNEKLDELERKMMEKAEVLSGFASMSGRIRHLFHVFKFYDQNNSGYINYPDFLDVLNKFNLSGYQREAEELFNRYDEDMLGHVDCRELSLRLHKVPPFRALSDVGTMALFAIRAELCGGNEFLGFRYYRAVMRLASMDGDGFVTLADMLEHIYPRTSKNLTIKNFVVLLSELDTRGDNRVNAISFLRTIKVTLASFSY